MPNPMASLKPHFAVGQKAVYLPNFVVTLLRTPRLPPTQAKFQVPLNLNKLDLRDYLFHAYGVRALSVRSYIEQQKVREDKPDATRPRGKRWFRPRSKKFMTVEMDRPFVWPDAPKSFDEWDKQTFEAANEDQQEQYEKRMSIADVRWPEDVDSIAEQAKRLLQGKETWKSGDSVPKITG